MLINQNMIDPDEPVNPAFSPGFNLIEIKKLDPDPHLRSGSIFLRPFS
jgi:hypothetical protein